MSATSIEHEIRCSHCQQSIQVPSEYLGYSICCPHCNAQNIAQVTNEACGHQRTTFAPDPSGVTFGQVPTFERPKSTATLRGEAKQAVQARANEQSGKTGKRLDKPEHRSAGCRSRIAAFVIDALVGLLSHFLGFIPIIALNAVQYVHKPVILRYVEFVGYDVRVALTTKHYDDLWRTMQRLSPEFWTVAIAWNSVFILFILWQLYLMSNGRSIGKKIMKIAVVDSQGFVPGFGQGVLLRSVPIWTLYIAAFYVFDGILAGGLQFLLLLNFMMIVVPPPRCFYDRLAGTYVVYH